MQYKSLQEDIKSISNTSLCKSQYVQNSCISLDLLIHMVEGVSCAMFFKPHWVARGWQLQIWLSKKGVVSFWSMSHSP